MVAALVQGTEANKNTHQPKKNSEFFCIQTLIRLKTFLIASSTLSERIFNTIKKI